MARITLREAISQALREEMYRDERVFIMGEEIGTWGGTYAVTRGFLDEFGERRVRDTPIAEGVIAGAAAGAAIAGMVSFCCCKKATASRRFASISSCASSGMAIPARRFDHSFGSHSAKNFVST